MNENNNKDNGQLVVEITHTKTYSRTISFDTAEELAQFLSRSKKPEDENNETDDNPCG